MRTDRTNLARSEAESLRNATILVTGGTGSFGRTVVRRLMAVQPKEIRIFSRDEQKQWKMRTEFPHAKYILGDVRDLKALERAMHQVDYVFHAAALKHVPELEEFPLEALQTNVHGSANLCEAANKSESVKVVVGLSTDKAVKPINTMGLSKAMMERIVCNQNRTISGPAFCCVRYGNVLASRGSIVPLFLDQIKSGAPLTITDPGMTRFLLTLEHATDLVLYAMTHAKGGEIFVRKAPACEIQTLADTMRTFYSPLGMKHPTKHVGVRAGEKRHEVLVNEYELPRATETESHYIIRPEYQYEASQLPIPSTIEYTSENTTRLNTVEEVGDLIRAALGTEEELKAAA